jgi:hypothetical protein
VWRDFQPVFASNFTGKKKDAADARGTDDDGLGLREPWLTLLHGLGFPANPLLI